MQMLRTYSKYWIFFLAGLLMTMTKARAGDGGGVVKAMAVLDGSLHQIGVDSSRTVQDSAFFNPAYIGNLDTAYSVQNIVTVKINEASTVYLHNAFAVTVGLRIYYTVGTSTVDSIDRDFTVKYDSAGVYDGRNSFVFYGARKVTVKVLSVASNVTGWDPVKALMVENLLVTRPKFNFSCTNTISSITVTPVADTADELPVSWTAILGADQYDLEWTYVDSSVVANGRYSVDPDSAFLNNATRATVTGTGYYIPLMYDDRGTLFIRVRPVQLGAGNSVVIAEWSTGASTPVLGKYDFVGHQRAFNWQSNISFAEEGKRKVVVQYFDGSLRSRQTVTKDNTTNTTIVAETYYDYQGRPAIQVMPSPTLNNVIHYTAGFNVSINSAEYSQSNYDSLPGMSAFCDLHAEAMDSTTGASQYYSANNPSRTIGVNQFIPTAKAFPFTETEYTPDNTGRINRQGGVGPDHQLGSGHETKYFYGTPDQHELDALFGTEVGNYTHYFKNMVRDANGQYSVSYVDMHGRTIATALAGNTPSGMEKLTSNVERNVTENLVDPTSTSIQDLSMVSQKSLLVTKADTYNFHYALTADDFCDSNCDKQQVCYTCLYDLEITITDNCNKEAWDTVVHNFSPGAFGTTHAMSFDFSRPFSEGNYLITKKLTVNKDGYNYYLNNVYLPGNTCMNLRQYIDSMANVVRSSNGQCAPDCGTCRDKVGTWTSFWTNFRVNAGISDADTAFYRTEAMTAYQNALTACDVLCQDNNTVDNDIRKAMLQDITPPYGQYADTLKDIHTDRYSIFFQPTNDDQYVSTFQLPSIVYNDENGNPDKVYSPSAGIMVTPNQLTTEEFVQNFKPSWAEALLPYHPEYCKLAILQSYAASNQWDKDFMSVNDYATAFSRGYLNPTSRVDTRSPFGYFNTPPANPDPLMQDAKGQPLYDLRLEMWDDLFKFKRGGQGTPTLSMWAVAVISVKCPDKSLSCVMKYADGPDENHRTLHQENLDEMCTADKDKAWQNFRDMYQNTKHDLFIKYQVNPPRGCIPTDHRQYGLSPTAGELFAKKHQPQFTDSRTALDNTDQKSLASVNDIASGDNAIAAAGNSTADFYNQNVHAYEDRWRQQLMSCKLYDTTDLKNTLIPRLYKMARQACDADHPFGASSLPDDRTDSTNPAFRDFQDIIDDYNVAHGINDALHCNGEVITEPAPYYHQPAWATKPVYSRPSDCECKLITDLNNTYLVSGRDASFSAFMQRTQGVTMTDADLNTLLMACRNTTNSATCLNFSHPIGLPPSMQCNVGAVCSDCSSIRALYRSYLNDHGADTPAYNIDVDTTQAQKNLLFQNYMNNRLGYQLHAWQYLQFLDSCNAHTDTVGTGICVRTVADTFHTGGKDIMRDIRRTSDGGYVMVGETTRPVFGREAYIIRYDSANNVQWSRTFGDTGEDYFWKVRVTSDKGYIAVGSTVPLGQDTGRVLVVRLSASGDTIWTRSIRFDGRGDKAFDVIQTLDGGFAVVGDHGIDEQNFPGSQGTGIMVIRLNSAGSINWARELRSNSSPGNDGYGIRQIGSSLFVTGREFESTRFYGSLHVLNDVDGSTTSNYQYQDPVSSISTSLLDLYPYGTGYRVFAFRAMGTIADSSHITVADISSTGAVNRYRVLNVPPGTSANGALNAAALVMTSDGGFLSGQSGANRDHIFWTKTDSAGAPVWSMQTKLPGVQLLGGIVQNTDSSYAALGTDQGTAMLLRLTKTGTTTCYDSSLSIAMPIRSLNSLTASGSNAGLTILQVTGGFVPRYISPVDSPITCNSGGNCYTIYNGPTLCGKAAPIFPPAVVPPITACTDSTFFSVSKGTVLYNYYSDSLIGSFEKDYLKKCLQAYKNEVFTVTHSQSEYHYTLYYYDQAGNLTKTVPPAGVDLSLRDTWYDSVKTARAAGNVLRPAHTLVTDYRFNTLNQVVSQKTPDAGISNFWYDRLGRLAISQNALQKVDNKYSYTKYDSIGRITQVGQLVSGTAITDAISRTEATLASWWDAGASSADQITLTTYDSANYTAIPALAPHNLRNRVAWTALYNTRGDMVAVPGNHATATYYSYDILGNVDTLVQDFKIGTMASQLNRFKKIVYDYDLVSGKVNKVAYQPGQPDAFYHTYLYDAENRITHVQTSADSINWDNDAFYSYYAHGPLARTILGEQQVQGINYAYTLQGWLKSINPDIYTGGSFTLRPDSSNNVVAATAYNVLLNYYNGDYAPVTGQPGPDNGVSTTLSGSSVYRPLFNGNISSMGVNVRKLDSAMLYNYQYDQLNRLVNMDAWRRTGAAWSAISATSSYRERVSYDPNGNILSYARNGKAAMGLDMDKMKYNYKTGTNQLDYIYDTVGHDAYPGDIDRQNAGNYKHDAIGQLISDDSADIQSITWTVYGKIASITKSDKKLLFTYDAGGNRISKSVVNGGDTTTTWYARDAQGNVMSVYIYGDADIHLGDLTQTEVHMYGAGRLGLWRANNDVFTPAVHNGLIMPSLGKGDSLIFSRGDKLFELTNHLGNVLATISDKRFGVMLDSVAKYFTPDVATAQDYFPFGMLQPGREYSSYGSEYRYGFNGKENDNEVKGTGNWQDYGMRAYDPRIGRFPSVDPLTAKYPWFTPYQFAGNQPIVAADLDGMEAWMKTQENLMRQDAMRKIDALFVRTQPISRLQTVSPTPYRDKVQQYQQEQYRIQRYQEIGYNDDGSKPAWMRLAENKTFKNFSGNIALPLLDGVAVVDGVYALTNLVRLGKAIETFSASRKISFLREAFRVEKTQNIGLLEGQIGNTKINDIAISGKKGVMGTVSMVSEEKRVFTTQIAGGYPRLYDSEVKLLENFAETYRSSTNVEGTLKLTSERPFCESCSGVIDQFKKMFPKIKLEYVNGTGVK